MSLEVLGSQPHWHFLCGSVVVVIVVVVSSVDLLESKENIGFEDPSEFNIWDFMTAT